jgi:hypothetical protein
MRFRAALLTLALPLPLLAELGCQAPDDGGLFARDVAMGAVGADLGGSAAAVSGTGSASGAQTNGGNDAASTASGSSNASGGVGASGGTGGRSTTAGSGGGPGSMPPIVIESCDMLEGAVTSELNGHCYRVNLAELTFAAARDACLAGGGHLVTISSEAEDDFARDLHDGVHWLGASDGFPDTMPGVGTYTWVDEEEWSFTHWEDGQPNAFETNCADGSDESDCFEHCAFQTDEGDWNDRSCWHTIVSICEWDVQSEPDPGGAAGAAGAGGAAAAMGGAGATR